MKILGCFKVVPDLEMMGENDWVPDSNNDIDVSFVKTLWNCYDESALEMMLKLSDQSEGFNVLFRLGCLTIGNAKTENYLKTLCALGFEKAVRIECEENLRFLPELTAGLISGYVSQKCSQDVVIMGKQSSDGNNGKVPLLVAEELGWPCITEVVSMQPVDEEHLKVISMTDEGELHQIVETPCVLSVGNATNTYLRVPTLKDRMKKGKTPVETVSREDLSAASGGNLTLESLEPVEQSREGILITGDSPKEKAEKLYNQYLKERLEKV